MGMITVYKTPLPASQGAWEPFKIPLRKLCNGDIDLDIAFVVEEFDKTKPAAGIVGSYLVRSLSLSLSFALSFLESFKAH
jgi:hypothetical protein